MKKRFQPVLAASFLMLAADGCDKDANNVSSTSKRPVAFQSAAVAQKPPGQVLAADFPVIPESPSPKLSSSEALVSMSDENLSTTFLNSLGAAWNQALLEMKKRQTPALVSVMAKNIDEIRGVAVLSGEAMYAPELRYPVARVLMDCGEKSIAELITVCTSPKLSFKKRLLAARVLLYLEVNGNQAANAEKIRSALSSAAEISTFNEVCAAAKDDLRVAAILSEQ